MPKWLRSQQPPCPLPRRCYNAGAAAGGSSHLHVIERLIFADLIDIESLAERAAKVCCFEIFDVLAVQQCLDTLPRLYSVFEAAGQGNLHTAKLLTPYLHNHASSSAVFTALSAAMRRTSSFLTTEPQPLEVINWLYCQFTSFTPHQKYLLMRAIPQERSPVLVELAASSCGPMLPWAPEALNCCFLWQPHLAPVAAP